MDQSEPEWTGESGPKFEEQRPSDQADLLRKIRPKCVIVAAIASAVSLNSRQD